MGLHDRPYWREDQAGGHGGTGRWTLGLPRSGRVVKVLLLVNVGAFILQALLDRPGPGGPGPLSGILGVTAAGWWQVWRYLTFQFLHGDFWHIALNMLGVYMLGSPLEATWGPRRFLAFYLTCGGAAGLAYVVIGAIFAQPGWLPLIGASGGVYGIVLACAALFPQFRLIFFVFPVPIRLAAAILFGGMALLVASSVGEALSGTPAAMGAAMSDVAHLGGAVAAAVWVWGGPRFRTAATGLRLRKRQGAWQRRLRREADEQAEIDRILDKIRDEGILRLTENEKRALQDATRKQREQEQQLHR